MVVILSVLHPHHKLEYFKAQKWENEWIQMARDIVRKEFDRSYKVVSNHTQEDAMQVDKDNNMVSTILTIPELSNFEIRFSKNIFDDLPDLAPTAADYRDELECYLATDDESVKDALMWWYERRNRFPRLSRMARDYLSIPGM